MTQAHAGPANKAMVQTNRVVVNDFMIPKKASNG
jgi:hypothetical protein